MHEVFVSNSDDPRLAEPLVEALVRRSERRQPTVFLFRIEKRPLALAFRECERHAIELPDDVEDAAKIVVATRR